ncbi:MAG: hypothetical protein JXR49_13225, partial [Acidobacteria bacterium]|nr:hypothetical protein [Acidobacteriota bacterium]
ASGWYRIKQSVTPGKFSGVGLGVGIGIGFKSSTPIPIPIPDADGFPAQLFASERVTGWEKEALDPTVQSHLIE